MVPEKSVVLVEAPNAWSWFVSCRVPSVSLMTTGDGPRTRCGLAAAAALSFCFGRHKLNKCLQTQALTGAFEPIFKIGVVSLG